MWEMTTLGELCKMYQPKTISTKEMLSDGEYVVYGANGVIGRYEKYNHKEPQLLVTCRGATCGAVNISQPFSWINGNAMVVQPDIEKVSLQYMEYIFRGGVDLSRAITGSAQPQITRQSLNPITIIYPPLAEQQRIVAKLDAAFAEIDRAIELADVKELEIEKLKTSLLEEQITGSNDNDTWEITTLSDVCTLKNGRAYKKTELLEKGKYSVLRVGNFFTSNRWYYSNLELEDTKYCDNGDLLYAWSASFGARIWEGGKVIYHYHIWRVDIDASKIDKRFLFYWFEFDKERIKRAHGTGTTMMHISKGSMDKRELSLPPLDSQKSVIAKLDVAFGELDTAKLAITRIKANYTSLKSAILAQELKGEAA